MTSLIDWLDTSCLQCTPAGIDKAKQLVSHRSGAVRYRERFLVDE